MFAFIHIEKAAGTTFTSILRRSFGARHCDVRGWRNAWVIEDDLFASDDLRRTRRVHWNLASIAGHGVKPYSDLKDICPEVRYYTIMREPIARCASHYQYQIQILKKSISLDEWIKDERMRNFQTKKFAGVDDVALARDMLDARVGFVGLVEHFNESLVMLRWFFGDTELSIGHRSENIASNQSISRELLNDAKSLELLQDANQEDVKLYQHVTDVLYPKQKTDYGRTLDDDLAAFAAAQKREPPGREPMSGVVMRRFVYRPILRTWYRWAT